MGFKTLTPGIVAGLRTFRANLKQPTKKDFKSVKVPTKAGGSYSYDYLPFIKMLEIADEALTDTGLAIVQDTLTTDKGAMGMTHIVSDDGGEFIAQSVPVPTGKDAQANGSAETYALRYSLKAALMISTDVDDDDGRRATEQARQLEELSVLRTKATKMLMHDYQNNGGEDSHGFVLYSALTGEKKFDANKLSLMVANEIIKELGDEA